MDVCDEILFDKDKIESLINEAKMIGQQKARSGGESIVAKISIKNDIKKWIKSSDALIEKYKKVTYDKITGNWIL